MYEDQVFGEQFAFRAVVAVLSRSVIIQGNDTSERHSHLKQCKEAGISGGEREEGIPFEGHVTESGHNHKTPLGWQKSLVVT